MAGTGTGMVYRTYKSVNTGDYAGVICQKKTNAGTDPDARRPEKRGTSDT
jgi:hypothetical protein